MNLALTNPGLSSPRSQITMVGIEEEDIESQQAIFSHAMNVHLHHQQMTESALKICISLYLCRQAFKSSSDKGWEAFCEANFRTLDMHMTHIRSAIRTGRSLCQVLNSDSIKQRSEAERLFASMSRHALTTFSETPEELREEVAERLIAISSDSGRPPTASDVRSEVDNLKLELSDAHDAIRLKDEALFRMNEQLQIQDTKVSELRGQCTRLNAEVTRLNTQPHLTVETADPSVKRTRKDLDDVTQKLQQKMTELETTRTALADAEQQREEILAQIEESKSLVPAAKKKSTVIQELRKEIAGLKEKWTGAYLEMLRTQGDSVSEEIASVAEELQLLANQLRHVAV